MTLNLDIYLGGFFWGEAELFAVQLTFFLGLICIWLCVREECWYEIWNTISCLLKHWFCRFVNLTERFSASPATNLTTRYDVNWYLKAISLKASKPQVVSFTGRFPLELVRKGTTSTKNILSHLVQLSSFSPNLYAKCKTILKHCTPTGPCYKKKCSEKSSIKEFS